MSGISTHVLDTAAGRPATGVKVRLFLADELIGEGVTDQEGRIRSLHAQAKPGQYRLLFEVGGYFPDGFYPEVSISFVVSDDRANYHVPLLLSPFGYTTYRGS